MSIDRTLYKLGFEISPVILTDGLASSIYGGMLPIVALTQTAGFISSLLSGSAVTTDLDRYFAHWRPMSGSTLLDYDIGQYPFANQTVAANAMIAMPLRLSMLMQAPINADNTAIVKLTTLSALQAALQAHAHLGGTYTIATPAAFYSNCVLRTIRDVTPTDMKNPQSAWQWEFEQPLITESGAESAVNSMLSKIDSGSKMASSAWTNASAALGNTALGGSVSSLANQITGLVGKLAL